MKLDNIMSVDLEDYFCDLPFSKWDSFESRVVETTEPILQLFHKYKVKATFFTLGYIAEKFPDLIQKIVRDGHEIASHGYSHLDIRKLSKEQFEEDLLKSIKILESITGEKILGFRAPFFSIDKNNLWALNIIRKYMKYDSSIFPVRTPLYGIPDAKREIYKPSVENPLLEDKTGDFYEIPPSSLHFPLFGNLPIAGGFHFRFFPLRFTKFGLNKLTNRNIPIVFYIHPKDLDKKMPKIKEYQWYFYHGLCNSMKKFENLLKTYNFLSINKFLTIYKEDKSNP